MAESETNETPQTADTTGDAAEPARPDEEPSPLVTKASDLDALRASVVDAASVSGGLWISYLGILFYLLIAIGSVTHRDLFLESPIRLPFLNVDLPMTGFFVIGPVLFLIAHAYVLLHFGMLADKISAFDHVLVARVADPEVRTELRRQLPANIFVQLLAGPANVRDGITGMFLWLIALITMVIGPILLMLFFELQFLPYHNELITWWQRIAVVTDLVLLWLFWPSIALREPEAVLLTQARFRRARAVQRAGTIAVMLVLTLVSPPLLLLIATFPGEGLEQALDHVSSTRWRAIPGRVWLVEGEIDETIRRPRSLFSNRLVLPGFAASDHGKSDRDSTSVVSARGRHLEGAVLHGADLRKVDFTAARLQDADFANADLREARFDCALRIETDDDNNVLVVGSDGKRTLIASDGQRTSIASDGQRTDIPSDGKRHTPQSDANCPWLQRARFDFAQLQGVHLDYVQLQGARLDSAQLQGASLNGTQLQGASLANAQLQGASLVAAQLPVASLTGAQLQAATLDRAQLQSASLWRTRLHGASLNGAQLQGAWMEAAQLQGASLDNAQLQGATLWLTQLQGASLKGTQLQDADITEIFVWRANAEQMQTKRFRSNGIYTDPKRHYVGSDERSAQWSKADFEALKRGISTTVPEGSLRDAALKRIDPMLDPDRPDSERDAANAKLWTDRANGEQSTPDQITQERVKAWRPAGCDPDGAPFVVTGLIYWLHAELYGKDVSGFEGQAAASQLAADFLGESCAGAHGISAESRTSLAEMANRAKQQAQ